MTRAGERCWPRLGHLAWTTALLLAVAACGRSATGITLGNGYCDLDVYDASSGWTQTYFEKTYAHKERLPARCA